MNIHQLKKKAIKGFVWSFLDIFANQGMVFIIQIFLARLITPDDFGVIGIVTIFTAITMTIVDSGFSNALIREPKVTNVDYSTVFIYNLFVSVLLYIILFFCARPLSIFFDVPKIEIIIKVIGIILIINAFGIIQRTIMIKKLEFRVQTIISIISSLISGLISILVALYGFGIWSLVIRMLIMNACQTLLLCFYCKWKPTLEFSWDSFRKLYKFGWKLLVSSMIDTIYQELYSFIIGKKYSSNNLGFYTNSKKLRDISSQSITTSIQKVSYPVLSELQNDDGALLNFYRKIIKTTVFITFPIMIGLASIANPFILMIYGEQWIDSVPYFKILCYAGTLYPLQALNLNILQVKGRTDLFLRVEIIKKTFCVIVIAIVMYFETGMMGLMWSNVIIAIVAYIINSYFSASLLSYSIYKQVRDIIPVIIASILMGITVYMVSRISNLDSLMSMLIQIITGMVSYVIFGLILKIDELLLIKGVWNKIFNKTDKV